MFRTAIRKSACFAFPALVLGLVSVTALTSANPVATVPQSPLVLRTVVSAGRSTAFTDIDQIENDVQADRIGELFGTALVNAGGGSAAFLPALRTIESLFASVQVSPKDMKYCYEYDEVTGRTKIVCKEVNSASIVENTGDSPVELHLELVTQP